MKFAGRKSTKVEPNDLFERWKTTLKWQEMARSAESPEEKIDCYSKILDILPIEPKLFLNFGIELERLGDFEKAEKCFSEAIKIDPTYQQRVEKRYRLNSDIHPYDCKIQDDLKCFYKAVYRNPNDTTNSFLLGMCLEKLGKAEQAEKYFSYSMENNPLLQQVFEKRKEPYKPDKEIPYCSIKDCIKELISMFFETILHPIGFIFIGIPLALMIGIIVYSALLGVEILRMLLYVTLLIILWKLIEEFSPF